LVVELHGSGLAPEPCCTTKIEGVELATITVEQMKELYIKGTRNLYFREMEIRKRTEIHRLAILLDMTELEVECIWDEDLST